MDRATWCALALLGLLLFQGLLFITASSQTSDEGAHLLAGYYYLTAGDFRLNREEPPLIKELAALPLLLLNLERPAVDPERGRGVFRLGPAFVHENRVPADTILLLGRLPVLILSLLLGWTLFLWGRSLFGGRGALLALALYVLDPNVVAHSGLVTTDLGVTLFIFLTIYSLWRWADRPRPLRLAAAGLFLGAAFGSKATAIWALPILAVLGGLHLRSGAPLPARPWSGRSDPAPPRSASRVGAMALAGAILVACASLVIALVCGVHGVPDFLAGFMRGLGHSATGHTAYLCGQTSERGWWYYFLFAFLVKTPPGTLLLVAASVALALLGRPRPLRDEMVLWVPVLLIIAITSVWRVNIGLRHLLPLYPFLFLLAGRAGAAAAAPVGGRPRSARRLLGGLVLACLLWSGFEAARIAPYNLAYFNALVGGPRNGHLYLLDSNLDWGQASRTLGHWMADERVPALYCSYTAGVDPRYYGVRYQYVPGIGNFEGAPGRDLMVPPDAPREILAVSATALHFVRLDAGTLYDWLKDRPVVAMPGYAFLAYDITGDAQAHARLARLYLDWKLPIPAAAEARRALRIDPDLAPARAVLESLQSR